MAMEKKHFESSSGDFEIDVKPNGMRLLRFFGESIIALSSHEFIEFAALVQFSIMHPNGIKGISSEGNDEDIPY